MKRIVIIPARGGSKRLPKKNKMLLDGKPLIFHTINAVQGLFDKVIFTSDSNELLNMVSGVYRDVIVDKRPEQLAGDTSKVIDTVIYYFNQEKFDQIWLTLPTCPLRTRNHVIEAQKALTENYNSIISITNFEFPPTLGLIVDDHGVLTEVGEPNFANGNSRSQDHPAIYRPNGALYGAWSESFSKYKNFYKGRVRAYYMPRSFSVDIDSEIDFKWADFLLKNKEYL